MLIKNSFPKFLAKKASRNSYEIVKTNTHVIQLYELGIREHIMSRFCIEQIMNYGL